VICPFSPGDPVILHSIAVLVLIWGILASFGKFRRRFLCTMWAVKIKKTGHESAFFIEIVRGPQNASTWFKLKGE
jgi:hypothetical protein